MSVRQRTSGTGEALTEHVLRVPERRGVQGPRTRRRLRRAVATYGAVFVLGMLPTWLGWGPAWRAGGLGLLWPGAGFLYTSDVVLLVLTLVAVTATLKHFWLQGNFVWPAAVWLAAAGGAVLRAHTGIWSWAAWAVPLVPVAAGVALFVRTRLKVRAQRGRGATRNTWLADVRYRSPGSTRTPEVRELSADDLAWQRWVFDLALQPVASWEGFAARNQVDMGSYRYQCNWLQWALALAQLTRTPAFDGYSSLAQRNLIEKMCDRRVWEYWRSENLWGNLSPDPDPVRRDNVMFSGYWSLMLEAYASNTGDFRYDANGALPMRWDADRVFAYDAGTIARALLENLSRSPYGAFPCEPGIVFTSCNAFALSGLLARARTHGEDLDQGLLERYRTTIDEELTDPSGSLLTALFRRYGVANTLVTTTAVDAGQALFLRPPHPEAAARTWEIVRREQVRVTPDGVDVDSPGIGRRLGNLDPGNGDRARTFLLATVAGIAREMGDEEVAAGLLARAEEGAPVETRDGTKRFARASNFTNGVVALTRAGRADGWYDLVRTGPPPHWLEGPVLAEAPYPGVLVARATTDGDGLSLVLRPGEGPGRHTVRLGRLRPGRPYDVRGGGADEIIADAQGHAEVTVELSGRTEVEVVPRG